jgi:hypothetical protein
MRSPAVVLVLLFSVALTVTVANAADPGSGKVSAASPTVAWKGQVVNSGITNNAWAQDPTFDCNAPACDRFTLEVADSANLILRLKGFKENTAGGDPGCGIRYISPDGESHYSSGTCGPATEMRVTVKNAPKGTYQVDVADSHVVGEPENYEASATLVVPAATAPAPAPAATPAAPVVSPAPATSLSVKAAAQSAKKLKKARRFTISLSSSAPLTGVNAILLNKRKQVGAGKLARLEGSGKLVVKLKSALKKGTYDLSVGGRDAQGRNVIATVKLKVKS